MKIPIGLSSVSFARIWQGRSHDLHRRRVLHCQRKSQPYLNPLPELTYHFLQPQAIRTGLDVYGENARKIVPIDSPHFGRVMCVCIGAMMVGSIVTTVNEGDTIARGQEFGYFAFGT